MEDVPVLVCVLWPDPESARACPRGDIDLVYCEHCGLIHNRAYDPALVEYTDGYENSLHFSEFFQGYIRDFAAAIAARHDLAEKTVVEIGCGDGSFLELICDLGKSRGIGYDPSYSPDLPTRPAGGRVEVRRQYYTDETVDADVDLVVCRQVLEHIGEPAPFLATIRRSLSGGDASLVVEVPNSLYTLEQVSLWDVIYEHCTYWTHGSLARALVDSGFDVTHASETYARQFIAVDGRPSAGDSASIEAPVDDVAALSGEVTRFEAAQRERLEGWQRRLAELRAEGKKVALWGTGARGVNFLNTADTERTIEQVVDINPRKHGLCAAGTGQRIGPPETLVESLPDVVVVMNPNYLEEITASLHALGLRPEVRVA
ncbi:MAG: class I SAM-dependent methyltransferase [Planctomycetota bacterium]